MLLLNDVRLKIIMVILVILSSAYWRINLPFFIIVLCLFFYLFTLKNKELRLFQGLLLGGLIASLHITCYQINNKLVYEHGHNITIKGEIQSLIVFDRKGSSVVVKVKEINNQPTPLLFTPVLRLSLRNMIKEDQFNKAEVVFQQGEIWTFNITLRPPIGRHNEIGYKLEEYALSQGIHSYGQILSATNKINKPTFRALLFQKVYKLTEQLIYQPILLALAFGYRGDITSDSWEVLRNSGLAHLVAISGLHIGLVYTGGWFLGKYCRFFIAIRQTYWLPVFSGLAFAFIYAWLAGFSIPTTRALVACLFISSCLVARKIWPKHQIILYCFLLSLLLHPFSFLSMGFWLSFSAVGAILFSLYLYEKNSNGVLKSRQQSIIKFMSIQIGLFLFLLPVQGYFFGGISLLAPFVNVVFIPWVSLLTVPLTLFMIFLSLVAPSLSVWGWRLADLSFSPVWFIAELCNKAWMMLSYESLFIILIFLFFLCGYLFNFSRSILVLVCVLLISSSARLEKSWRIDFLDVGHGLAVLIHTEEGTVLYDTGMAWDGGSIAEMVIEPILYSRGENSLLGLILSHSDNDHAGGKEYVLEKLTPRWVRTSEIDSHASPCIKGEKWQVGEVTYDVLWPPKLVKRAYNPHSCVIKLTINQWNFLLTGDIDAISEMLLLSQNDFNDIDLFLVPHHGSSSSSTKRWVSTMKDKIGLVSAGLFTPWQLPNKEIKRRYERANIQWLDTAQLGQIQISERWGELKINKYGNKTRHLWYRKLFGDNLNSE